MFIEVVELVFSRLLYGLQTSVKLAKLMFYF